MQRRWHFCWYLCLRLFWPSFGNCHQKKSLVTLHAMMLFWDDFQGIYLTAYGNMCFFIIKRILLVKDVSFTVRMQQFSFLLIWWQYLELLRNVGCICPTIKNYGSDHVNYILDWFRWWNYNFRDQLYFYQLICFWAKLLKCLHSVYAVYKVIGAFLIKYISAMLQPKGGILWIQHPSSFWKQS